jgi:hypothetical protein
MAHNIFRDGRVHLMKRMCPTCIFRPGNLMGLEPGRVEEMVLEASKNDSTIVCHATLIDGRNENAACRGFFDRYATAPLQIAQRMGLITEVEYHAS